MLYVQVPRPGAGSSEPHPVEILEEAFGGDETGDGDTGSGGWVGHRVGLARRDEHPLWRLARALSRHRQVVLNVVLAVVLLWLIAFGKNTPSAGRAKND
uniref:Uncharacterized protein n=1 Tax=Arundo donax TaxID=35708 RepID=A0A0A9G157_ARUDO